MVIPVLHLAALVLAVYAATLAIRRRDVVSFVAVLGFAFLDGVAFSIWLAGRPMP